ncbi:MAG: hypothetical protein ACRDRX_07405 [Pseudonocardiaceae bacterium]
MDAWTIVGIIGGAIGALACIVAAASNFTEGNNGWGVACLALTPIAYFVVSALAVFVVCVAVVIFLGYIAMIAITMDY